MRDKPVSDEALTLRPMDASDMPLLHAWLQREHVREWWGRQRNETLESVSSKYLPRVRGETHVSPFIAMLGETPIGYCQSYRCIADEFCRTETDPGTFGCDQFIGEGQLLDMGLGTRIVSALVDMLFKDASVLRIQTNPSPTNVRAIRCYEKAGFRPLEIIVTSDGNALLMVQDRAMEGT